MDLYEVLSDEISEDVTDTLRAEDELMFEKEVDNIIWDKVSSTCPSNIDHYDLIDKVKEKVDSGLYRAYGVPA